MDFFGRKQELKLVKKVIIVQILKVYYFMVAEELVKAN